MKHRTKKADIYLCRADRPLPALSDGHHLFLGYSEASQMPLSTALSATIATISHIRQHNPPPPPKPRNPTGHPRLNALKDRSGSVISRAFLEDHLEMPLLPTVIELQSMVQPDHIAVRELPGASAEFSRHRRRQLFADTDDVGLKRSIKDFGALANSGPTFSSSSRYPHPP